MGKNNQKECGVVKITENHVGEGGGRKKCERRRDQRRKSWSVTQSWYQGRKTQQFYEVLR